MSMEPTLKTPIETMMPFGVPKLGINDSFYIPRSTSLEHHVLWTGLIIHRS